MLRLERHSGASLEHYIPALARLRIEVFREFPYLYRGDQDYESQYLQTYIRSAGSVIVLALDGEEVVGAATGLPLRHETEEFKRPFSAHGYEIEKIFYFGESVLRKTYRGQGIGVQFFSEREAHARSLGGFDITCFCAVQRPPDHPRRPPDYVPLDSFWQKRGYAKQPSLQTDYVWQDLDEDAPSAKPMVFWLKHWPAPT
ncbi:MAG: GNAT family N-acetyltransferase [Candidatus Competibacteraceae bacterium]|nr:GNAT family N-acetyltransferase [Candidatus Competibacteraceae bacterium]MCB1805892.1 GNAT family N-acetyltransferase [Candidatus Competibacteraceae bacterium]MCB1811340.1 GNAT family N-acetyltransferase [Candidatus Competibacteraceae bacterium]